MTNLIELHTTKTDLTKDFILNDKNVNELLTYIENLKTIAFDFNDKEEVKKAKNLKTQANKFVAELKKVCEPLEAEGKKVADIRSKISTKLSTGKDNVIDTILKPINDAEDKLKYIKTKCATLITDLHSVSVVLSECDELEKFNWLYLKDEGIQLINQLRGLALVSKQNLEAQQKAEFEAKEKIRLEREEQIRKIAEEKAKAEAQRQIEEANRRAEQAIIDAENKIKAENELKIKQELKAKAEEEAISKNREHRARIHNEILQDIQSLLGVDAKIIVEQIAKGKIRNLFIKY